MKIWKLAAALAWTTTEWTAAKTPTAFLDALRYWSDPPNVEVHLAVDAGTLTYLKTTGGYSASARVSLTFFMDGKAVVEDRFTLTTPNVRDTSPETLRFHATHSERYFPPTGTLRLEVKISDANDVSPPATLTREFSMPATATFSDVAWIEKPIPAPKATGIHVKNGYVFPPRPTCDYFHEKDTMRFYVEAYGTENLSVDPVYFTAEIQTNGTPVAKSRFKPTVPTAFTFLAAAFDIRKLPSQTHVLVVRLHKNDGSVLAETRRKFYVYNPSVEAAPPLPDTDYAYQALYGYDEKELDYFIPTLDYIAGESEKNFARSLKTFEEKKNYFYHFWDKRTGVESAQNWGEYLKLIQYANRKFTAMGKEGWKTERGRVLLTYGPPSDIQDFTGQDVSVPYEIWTYNKLKSQSGVNFVFAAPSLNPDQMELVHSTLVGEVYNPNWRQLVGTEYGRSRIRNFNMDAQGTSAFDKQKDFMPGSLGAPRGSSPFQDLPR
jgi:GWxTD domain-containing protein